MSATVAKTTCPMDCPDTCTLEVRVEDGRIREIRGAQDEPLPGGFICSKVAHFDRRVYHADRVLHPLRRRGAKGHAAFERITWDEAIAEIVTRFREIIAQWSAEAIVPYHYGGSNGYLSDGLLDDYFFARLGASRIARTLCAVPATLVATGMYGKMPGVAFEDFPHAKCIIVWGANPKASNIHLVPFLRAAKRAGAFVAVVDPRNNFSAGEIDLHLPVYPGTDLPVALAMIRKWDRAGLLDKTFLAQHADGLDALLAAADAWTLERAASVARVEAGAIRRLAEKFAQESPAVIRVGWGLERNTNGAQAMAAILALPALLGKFGVRGGGYTLSNSGAMKLDVAKIFNHFTGEPGCCEPRLAASASAHPSAFTWTTRELNMSQLGTLLTEPLEPPIKALFVYNCNPAATAPDQNAVLRGLAREDLFTVVHEQVMTDTAQFADIVLPATTFLEHYDVRRGYGNYFIGGTRPVIPPAGEAKPNEEVFSLLGRAMGWHEEFLQWDSATWVRKIAAAVSYPGGPVNAERLLSGEGQRYNFPGEQPVQFGTVHPLTPDGKIHLTPAVLGPRPFVFAAV
ncbi:MAG TPA: molybdopterin-dependent oxidoreductase, partial [Candidatus Nitrosotenuis sp.]|nr:molybdopterin-dependent oxidoreductase [Candidatus Nitrosotenuis sp.]